MKIKTWMMMSILVSGLALAPAAFGQDPDEPETGKHGRWQQQMANLSQPEREKLEAAREKAMQDPAVQTAQEKMKQARKQFRDSLQAAMLKADPSIQPILDKMPAHRHGS
jgi:hypothetical protein